MGVEIGKSGTQWLDATITPSGGQNYLNVMVDRTGAAGNAYYVTSGNMYIPSGTVSVNQPISLGTGTSFIGFFSGNTATSISSVYVASGNEVITGSVAITNTPSVNAYVPSGTVSVNQPISLGTGANFIGFISGNVVNTGSVAVTNTVPVSGNTLGVYGQSGGTFYGLQTDTTGKLNVNVISNPSQNVFVQSGNAWAGIGSVLVTGSVNIGGNPASWTGVGSVLVTGSVNIGGNPANWTGVGSTFIAGGSVNVTNMLGSVAVTNTMTCNSFLVSGALSPLLGTGYKKQTYATSGTYLATNLWAPANAGSKVYVYGWDISTDTAMLVRVLSSGTSLGVIANYWLPASGTVCKTFIRAVVPGAAGIPIGIGLGAAGNCEVTLYAEDLT